MRFVARQTVPTIQFCTCQVVAAESGKISALPIDLPTFGSPLPQASMTSIPEPITTRPIPPSRPILGLLAWLVLCFTAAGIGAIASVNASGFYQQLLRPSWAPPGWLFGPVWSVLYVSMAVAAWLVWRIGGWRAANGALALFVIQLVANALWTWLFFYFQRGALATLEIVVLWALIVATIVQFWRLRSLAGALLLPYLAWVSFASVLSLTMWRLNPGPLGG